MSIVNQNKSSSGGGGGGGSPDTSAQVKSKYESNTNTNAFTDAEKTKLANVVEGGGGSSGGTSGAFISQIAFPLGDTVNSVQQLLGTHVVRFNAANTANWAAATVTATRGGVTEQLSNPILDLNDGEISTATITFTQADIDALAGEGGHIDFNGVALDSENAPIANIHIGQIQVRPKFQVNQDGFGKGIIEKPVDRDSWHHLSADVIWDNTRELIINVNGTIRPLAVVPTGVLNFTFIITAAEWLAMGDITEFPVVISEVGSSDPLYARLINFNVATDILLPLTDLDLINTSTLSFSPSSTDDSQRTLNFDDVTPFDESKYFSLALGSSALGSEYGQITRLPLVLIPTTANVQEGLPVQVTLPVVGIVSVKVSKQNDGGQLDFKILFPIEFAEQSATVHASYEEQVVTIPVRIDHRDILVGKSFNQGTMYPIIPNMFHAGKITSVATQLRAGSMTFDILMNGVKVGLTQTANSNVTTSAVDIDFVEGDTFAIVVITEPSPASDMALGIKVARTD